MPQWELTINKVSFSFYEVYISSLRALSSMGFPYGADEDAAYLVTWLELHKLNGIKKLAELSSKIDNKYQGKTKLEEVESKEFINLSNITLLMKGPSLFDYFLEKTKKNENLQIVLENCIDPIFIIPLAEQLSNKIKLIHACWINHKNKKILINVSKNKILIGEIKKNLKISKKQVMLKFSMNGLSKFNNKTKLETKYTKYKINENTKQNRLETSLNPNPKDWKIISKLAHRTFVPSTKESRDKGAGGGDDND